MKRHATTRPCSGSAYPMLDRDPLTRHVARAQYAVNQFLSVGGTLSRVVLPDIAAKGCDELWLNPGTESDAVLGEAERLGLNTIQACSIVAIGG